MKARSFRLGDIEPSPTRHGVGVRPSAGDLLSYELSVIAAEPLDAVRAAGGWMCDRVRAGWKVNVLVPQRFDPRPLGILGVRAYALETDLELLTADPAALAVSAQAWDLDARMRRNVVRAVERRAIEVSVWGARPPEVAGRVEPVVHRLSPAARAFKAQALIAAGDDPAAGTASEEFHSCALWYPLDGPDLISAG
ncbi:MAG: hypothetical protein HYZ39_14480 [Mycolicibacterium cosmeticum]|nr:hypothetical protein [Mycolicibacterium cosmeticum]